MAAPRAGLGGELGVRPRPRVVASSRARPIRSSSASSLEQAQAGVAAGLGGPPRTSPLAALLEVEAGQL